jgi:ribosomal protein S27AE
MRPFNVERNCPKCGCLDVGARHLSRKEFPNSRSYYDCERRENTEHIHRHCRRCGFNWDEAPLDGGAAETGENSGGRRAAKGHK